METQKFPTVRRLIVTFVIVLAFGVVANMWNTLLVQYRAISAASLFANDDPLAFAFSTWFRNSDLVGFIGWIVFVGILAVIWWPWLKKVNGTLVALVLLSGSLLISNTACANRATTDSEKTGQDDVVTIKPNETAFAVPALSASESGQAQTRDEVFFEANKVKAQTKIISKTLIGGRYIPTLNVIIVPHSPVSRLWTKKGTTGTSTSDESMCVEDNVSVNVCFQIAMSAIVEPRYAAKFLFHFQSNTAADPQVGGLYRAVPLENVVDNQVHTYLYGQIATRAGSQNLDYIIANKSKIVTDAETATKTYFADQGITIFYATLGGELVLDEKVQDVITRLFVAEKEQKIAHVQATTVAINAAAQRKAIEEKGAGDATAFAQLVKAWGSNDLSGLGQALESYRWDGNRLTVTLAPTTPVAIPVPTSEPAPTAQPAPTATPKK